MNNELKCSGLAKQTGAGELGWEDACFVFRLLSAWQHGRRNGIGDFGIAPVGEH